MKFNSKAVLLVVGALILAGTAFCAVAIVAPDLLSSIPPHAQLGSALVMGVSVALAAVLLTDPLEDQYLGP
jgi:hypothetical protein